MPMVGGSIPNLINGVSQQAASLRLPSQGAAQENYYSTVVNGLIKRPRTDHLSELLASMDAGTFSHFILRDEVEQYVVFVKDDGSIRVFDFFGGEYTVTNEAPDYLSAGDRSPQDRLVAMTIADHTFFVNRDVTVEVGTDTAPTRPYEALFYVQTGNYSKTYSITVNGALAASYTTPDSSDVSHEGYVDTTYIAEQLRADLASGVSSPFYTGRYRSSVYLANPSVDFTCAMADGYGGRASAVVHNTIQKFADLPTDGPNGFVVEVAGSDATNFDNYWVKLTEGVWKETLKPGARLGFDAATMPHILVRNPDNTFTFKAVEWGVRKCGDEDTVPDPSFVGKRIEDVFFHRNRLGFLTEDNVVLSESGQFYNFYRPTLTTTLDTDPIDVGASHTKVSLLRSAVPHQDSLILFADGTQFRLAGNELLTPKSVSARPLTELVSTSRIKPVGGAEFLYFVTEQDGYAQLYEYFVNKQGEKAEAEVATAHVPAYIPSGVRRMTASPDLNVVILATDGDPTALYVYKYFVQGQEKLQAAWSKWRFQNCERIINVAFDRSFLLVLMQRNGRVVLERMRLGQGVVDTPLDFIMSLDQRAIPNHLFWTYDFATDRSTLDIPYPLPEGLVAVTLPGGPRPMGQEVVPINDTELNADHIIVRGDWRGQPVVVGVPFESRYTFSPFFFRGPSQSGGSKPEVKENGRLQVLSLNLSYSNSGSFRVEVTPESRGTRTYTVNSRRLNAGTNVLGEMNLASGHINIPVLSRNDRVVIDLVSDSWLPAGFDSADWRGTFTPTTREL